MVETGLIIAEVVFLVLLYLFIWSVVRSSSRQLSRVQPPPPPPATPSSPVAPPSAAEAERLRVAAAAPAAVRTRGGRLPDGRGPSERETEPGLGPERETEPGLGPERETEPGLGPEGMPVELDPTPLGDPQPTMGFRLAEAEAAEGGQSEAQDTGQVAQPTAESAVEAEPTARVAGEDEEDEEARERASRRESGPIFDLSGLSPRLVVESSPALPREREFPLEGGMTIGRSGAAEMSIRDQYVSHMHARILRRGAYYFVADLGSTNGTFLNDRRVESDAQLKVHDTLRIGQTVLRYEE